MDKRFAPILMLMAFFVAACGAAAAPPVDLPAPVTGQIEAGKIDVSPPDSSGKSTITGSSGAVTGDAIVLAGNENQIETALLWKISDALIRSAYAQSLPSVCSSAGYSCTTSESDGSFSMTIDAVVGDPIFVVLIDSSGDEISSRSSFAVPAWEPSLMSSGCAGASAYGYLADLKNAGGNPLLLFEGDGEADAQNVLQIGTGTGSQRIDLPGCYAKRLAVYPLSADTFLIAMISTSDQVVWSGILNSNGLIGINANIISGYPLAAAFVDDPSELLIAKKDGSNFVVEKIALDTGSASGTLTLPTPPTGETLDGILGLKVLGPFADGGYLGAVVSEGIDGSSNRQFFMLFFNAGTFDVLSSTPNERLGYEGVGGGVLFPIAAHDLADFGLGYDAQSAGLPLILVLSDHGNGSAHKISLQHNTTNISFESDTMSVLNTDKVNMSSYFESTDRILPMPTTVSPKRLALGVSFETSFAYFLTDENYIWKLENYPMGISATQGFWSIPGASYCNAIGLDDPTQSIFVGDVSLGDAIDASACWGP